MCFTAPSRSEENTRSLFHERSFTSRSNSSLSSRRPSFSASNFSSPTFIDRTLSTQRVLNSPFYNGRTIYGGASAYGRKLGRSSSELRSNLNNSVEVKPKNGGNNESLMLSKTARRILDTLEQYTTPVNDAKKIPVVARRHVRQQEGLLSKFTGANPYARDVRAPSNTELHIPTVPELLKMKQQLQESTEAVREIATHSKSTLNKEEYKLPVVVEEAASKHTSKIKTKVCTVRQKPTTNNEVTEAVKLPAVALPISTLPKFDFSVPPPTPKQDKTEPPKTNPTTEYKFSDPIVITENIDNIIGANNFKFSEPIAINLLKNNFKVTDPSEFKPKRVQKNNGEIQPAAQLVSGSVMDVLFGKEGSAKTTPTTNQLLEKFKPKEGTWECQSCMVRNEAEKTKCVACETAKVAPSATTTTNPLLEKFKPAEGTWECPICMIRNKPDLTRCAACESPRTAPPPKPQQPPQTTSLFNFTPNDQQWQCTKCKANNKKDTNTCSGCKAARFTFGFGSTTTTTTPLLEKFKPPEGTWECSMCMIRNKPDVTRCAACESPKTAPPPQTRTLFQIIPNDLQWQCTKCKANNKKDTDTCSSCKTAKITFGFGEQFKAPKETWECSTCMVRNQKSAEKCIACESPNPEAAKKVNSGFGGQFTKKSSDWECPSCMVKNSTDKTKCVCCETAKPGVSDGLDDKKSGYTKFSFGVDKQATSKFVFGIKPTTTQQQQQNNSNSFVFGDTTKKPATSVAQTTFSFGLPAKATTTQAENKTEKPLEPPKPIATPSSLPSIPSNLFSTTTTTTTTKSESATTIKPLFQFSTTTTTTSETKPSNTIFGTTAPPKTFSFGGSTTTAPTSKNETSDDAAPPAKMPAFSFGAKSADDKPKETASGSGGFSFGGENKAPTFQFNAPATVAPPTQNGFSFGSAAAAAGTNSNNQASGFSFGKVAAAPAAGIFSFGSNSNTQVSFFVLFIIENR